MAPKNKFTREEMVAAALRVVRRKGADALTAGSYRPSVGKGSGGIYPAGVYLLWNHGCFKGGGICRRRSTF